MDSDDHEILDAGSAAILGARDVEVCHAPATPARSDLDFGVVVGVEHYPYFQSLRGAASDARAFYEWLCDAHGGGLDEQNVDLILSDLQAETPVQDQIDRRLLQVLNSAFARGGARRLYFYFSGHGATNPQQSADDVALLLTRWSSNLARLALSTDRYSSKLSGAGLFEEVAIFIDCCRTTSVSAVGVSPTITRVWSPRPHATTTFIAYATQDGQPAFELAESDEWHGIFTRCLLSILRGSPAGIQAEVLKNRLESAVEREARRRGVFQRASAKNNLHEHSCFGHGGALPVLEIKFEKRKGKVVLYGGDLQVVAEHQVDDPRKDDDSHDVIVLPWRIALPTGLYLLEGSGQDAAFVKHDGLGGPHVL